jgi:hypothetical protein
MAQLQATTVNGTLTSLRTENVQTGNYILALTDRDRVVAMNNTAAATVTIPNDSSVNFPIGSVVYVNRINTGSVTLAGAGGVTVGRSGNLADFEELFVRKRANNFWMVVDVTRPPSTTGGAITNVGGFRIHSFTSGTSTFGLS